MFNRNFTRREKILMVAFVAILIAGLYVLLVHQPIAERMEELQAEQEDILLNTDIATVRLGEYRKMKKELEEIFKVPVQEVTVMPSYDNIKVLMSQLNIIFRGMDPQLSFGEPIVEGGVAVRPVQFSFTASSYEEARYILTLLTDTGWRSLLNGLTISPLRERGEEWNTDLLSGRVLVSGNVTFYENAKKGQVLASVSGN